MNLQDRAFKPINLAQYAVKNQLDKLLYTPMECPYKHQYILRMLVKAPFTPLLLPKKLMWLKTMLEVTDIAQGMIGIRQPYCYITVRHGLVTSETDDEWHVDGFSMNITHLPEQNYVWTNVYPTEYVEKALKIPETFDPLKHNLQWFIQDNIGKTEILPMECMRIHGLDPYIIHRRPQIPEGVIRTFVRISYTPIPIMDKNNTQNPLLKIPKWNRDGINDFRNKLIRFIN